MGYYSKLSCNFVFGKFTLKFESKKVRMWITDVTWEFSGIFCLG